VLDPESSVPGKVILAGDWHANSQWACHVITMAAGLLDGEPRKIIIQLGDFGFLPGKQGYLSALQRVLADAGAELWFIDGNHEWHPELQRLHADEPGPVRLGPPESRIWHLPRGTRWEWRGRKWLAVGGAGSVDWIARTPGQSWWPEEIITGQQAYEICAGGRADVMLCHDCPPDAWPTGLPAGSQLWDYSYADKSNRNLGTIWRHVSPSRTFHGHLHGNYLWAQEHADRQVQGLDMDGENGNYAVLSTDAVELSFPERASAAVRARD
jgi:hypothetical protein